MSNNLTWAEAMQRLVKFWHVENPEHPIQRQNFLKVASTKEITTWNEFRGLVND